MQNYMTTLLETLRENRRAAWKTVENSVLATPARQAAIMAYFAADGACQDFEKTLGVPRAARLAGSAAVAGV